MHRLLRVLNKKEYDFCVHICVPCVYNLSTMSGTNKHSIITIIIQSFSCVGGGRALVLNSFSQSHSALSFSCFMPSANKFSSHAHSVVDTIRRARDQEVSKTDKVPSSSTKAIPGSFILLSSWVFPPHSVSGHLLD